MTMEDKLALLKKQVELSTQSAVAARLGYSPTTISQVLSGVYGGGTENVLNRVEEVYGTSTVQCPGLNQEITLGTCAAWRRKSKTFAATNPTRVRMYRACKNCPHNGGRS